MRIDRRFAILFTVMLTIAAGNTALQSVLPALGRSLGVPDAAVAAAFSVSALLWVIAAPFWAGRSDRHGRRAMILTGMGGFTVSLMLCGVFLTAGINGWIGGTAAFGLFILGRLLYGGFGAAAPPAVQALVAGSTTRAERTKALTLLGSAFGLGTIVGPAIAPYLILGSAGGVEIGLAGPAFVGALFGGAIYLAVRLMLPDDAATAREALGAMSSYPSIGGQATGATVTASMNRDGEAHEAVGFLDRRIRGWMTVALVMGHAQAMGGQAIGFLVIDRLRLAPADALEPTGLVLIMASGAALLAQWGIIPLLDLKPRQLVLSGLALAAVGSVLVGFATSLYGIAVAFALGSLGFGFVRPGYTAGASLAVGAAAQGSVAGKVTSVNGASFVLGPSIGVALYQVDHSLPYVIGGVGCALLFAYAWRALTPPGG
jgi:MFS family permease